jgi:alpha 1,2-mannosyltransferase
MTSFSQNLMNPSANQSFSQQQQAIVPYNPFPTNGNSTDRANATLLILARNSDINGVVQSMQSLEDRFNRHYNYPWVFLNEEPFSEEFKEYATPIRVFGPQSC